MYKFRIVGIKCRRTNIEGETNPRFQTKLRRKMNQKRRPSAHGARCQTLKHSCDDSATEKRGKVGEKNPQEFGVD